MRRQRRWSSCCRGRGAHSNRGPISMARTTGAAVPIPHVSTKRFWAMGRTAQRPRPDDKEEARPMAGTPEQINLWLQVPDGAGNGGIRSKRRRGHHVLKIGGSAGKSCSRTAACQQIAIANGSFAYDRAAKKFLDVHAKPGSTLPPSSVSRWSAFSSCFERCKRSPFLLWIDIPDKLHAGLEIIVEL